MKYKLAILKLAAYYDKVLTDQQIQIYSDQLAEYLTEDEANASVKLYIDQPLNDFFPRPVSKLIALIKPPVTDKDESQNLLDLLIQAIRKHGQYWSDGVTLSDGNLWFFGKNQYFKTWTLAAQDEIGTLGIEVIKRNGSWLNFCMSYFDQPEGVFKKQAKDSIETTVRLARNNQLGHVPQIDGGSGAKVLSMIKMKSLNEPESK